jgi:hypothetical protein
MLVAYIFHSRYSQVDYNCALIKVDCTKGGWRAVFVIFLWRWRTILHSPLANEKQEPVPEEMSQPLLTHKNQGNLN